MSIYERHQAKMAAMRRDFHRQQDAVAMVHYGIRLMAVRDYVISVYGVDREQARADCRCAWSFIHGVKPHQRERNYRRFRARVTFREPWSIPPD